MTKYPKQTLQKITQILKKPESEREYQQLHYLSLTFKKSASSITHITDWWMLSKCIQNFELHNEDNIQRNNIEWVLVLKGCFVFQGMTYSEGQYSSISIDDYLTLQLHEDSVYCILTRTAKARILAQSQERMISEKKVFARKIIFQDVPIFHKDLNIFWEKCQQFDINKDEDFQLNSMDDMIFIIIKGSVNINYQWKRLIKLRELGPGSIFSTFLGRYFYKTAEEVKTMDKFQFEIVGNTPSVILGFSPDIFYENQKFIPHKFVVQKAWKYYLQRVAQVKRIINGIGLLRPEKKQVIKNMQEQIEIKYLREKGISVPVAIERRKLRKITYSIFQQKSNRRKIPNLALTQSAKTISTVKEQKIKTNPAPKSSRKQRNFSQQRDFKLNLKTLGERSNTQRIKRLNTLPSQNVEQMRRTFLTRSKTERGDTTQMQLTLRSKQDNQQSKDGSTFYRFFRPEQFISKKLKNHYESIRLKNLIKLPLQPSMETLNNQKFRSSKSKKQYFEEYVNERRIVKLGPKKRLLYKQKPGF